MNTIAGIAVRLATTGLPILLGACAGAAPSVEWWTAAAAHDDDTRIDPAAFPFATQLVDGLDAPGPAEHLTAGDRALFAVELRDVDATPRWLLLVEIVEPAISTPVGPVFAMGSITVRTDSGREREANVFSRVGGLRLTRFDLDGRELARSEIQVPHLALEHGFAKACVMHELHGLGLPTATDAELDSFGKTIVSLQAVLQIVRSDAQLAAILQSVARAPSLLSIVGNLGVRVAIVPDFIHAHRLGPWPADGDPLWRIPLTITANDEPAVLALVDVVEPRSPWNLSAGLVRLTARRPGDERARLVMQLLAARRGET